MTANKTSCTLIEWMGLSLKKESCMAVINLAKANIAMTYVKKAQINKNISMVKIAFFAAFFGMSLIAPLLLTAEKETNLKTY